MRKDMRPRQAKRFTPCLHKQRDLLATERFLKISPDQPAENNLFASRPPTADRPL